MDVLADWLKEIGTNAVILCQSRVPAPWGMRIAARREVMFHIVAEGSCWLRRSGEPPLHIQEGDLVLLPQGLEHELMHEPNGESEALEDFLAKPSVPLTGGAMTTLVCGVYRSDPQLTYPVLCALPPVVHFSASVLKKQPALAGVLSLLLAEIERPGTGR